MLFKCFIDLSVSPQRELPFESVRVTDEISLGLTQNVIDSYTKNGAYKWIHVKF